MATILCQGEISGDVPISTNATSTVDQWKFIFTKDKNFLPIASTLVPSTDMLQASAKTKDNWEWIFHFDKNLLVPTMNVRNMGVYSGVTKTILPFYWGV